MKCNEALRPLQLRAADAGGHRGLITAKARSISGHDTGSVPQALEPPVGVSIAVVSLKIKIGVQGHSLPLGRRSETRGGMPGSQPRLIQRCPDDRGRRDAAIRQASLALGPADAGRDDQRPTQRMGAPMRARARGRLGARQSRRGAWAGLAVPIRTEC